MDGYIKLFRKIIKSPIFENERLLKIWIWCLCKASHTETSVIVGLREVGLNKGQFVFGLVKASEELRIPKSTVYRNMKALESFGMLTIKAENKYSIVTVGNWEKYQCITNEGGTEMKPKRKTDGKQTETYKNVKNDKEIYSAVPAELKEAFMEYADMRRKIKKPITTEQTVARAISRLNRLGKTAEEKIAILNQSTDNCWQGLFELKEPLPAEKKTYKF